MIEEASPFAKQTPALGFTDNKTGVEAAIRAAE
jgi:hypothetical protein